MEGITSSVEDVDKVTKKIKVSIPADIVGKEYDTTIQQLATTTKLKGFRQGKAPKHLIEKMHGQRVHLEVANRLISNSLQDLVTEHKIDMVGSPEIDIASFEPGKQIEYTAQVAVFPVPEVSGYDKMKVEVPKREVTDQDMEQIIDRMRDAKATTKKLELRTTAKMGDVIDASLIVQSEGEKEGGRPEPLVIALGDKRLPDELEQGIVGMEIGQAKEITVQVPDTHANKEIAGKKNTYKVVLNSLSEKVLPELTDEFTKSLNLNAQTVLELKLEVRKQLEEESERELKADTYSAILDVLLERNDFLVPQIIIDDEIRGLLVRNGVIDPQKVNPSQISMEHFRENFDPIARKRVRTAIIVDRIGENEGIKVSDDEVFDSLKKVAESNNLPYEDVRKYFLSPERRAGYVAEQTRNKILDFLLARTEVKYTKAKEKKEGAE